MAKVGPDNLFQDMLEDDFVQIFEPMHNVQRFLGFQRVHIKYNFVTGPSTQSQFYAGVVIFINIVCVVDVVINCESVLKTKFTDESLKLGLILNAIITNVAIWRNNFFKGNLNSMIYVKLQRLDRDLNMTDRRSYNRKLASLSLFFAIQTVITATIWILLLNFATMNQFYPTTIFAIAPAVGNYMEILLCCQILLFLSKRVDYVNKLLQSTMKRKPKIICDSNYSLTTEFQNYQGFRVVDTVLVMHNILDILSDFINLFQFEIFGFICQFISWNFITMRNFVNSIKEQTSINVDMMICNIPLSMVMIFMVTGISLIGGALTNKLEKSRKLCINISSYCEDIPRANAKQILSMMIQNKYDVSIYDIFNLNSQLPLELFAITANYTIVFLQFAML